MAVPYIHLIPSVEDIEKTHANFSERTL